MQSGAEKPDNFLNDSSKLLQKKTIYYLCVSLKIVNMYVIITKNL